MRRRFRGGRPAFEGKLAQREGRVSLPELGDLLQSRRQPRQFSTPTQTLDGLQLIVCSSASPDEVRVIRVREAIGPRPRGRDDRALLEEQHGPARTGEGKCIRDRLHSLRVGNGVSPAVEDSQAYSFLVCDTSEEIGALDSRAADLEVRGSRTTQGAAPEQRPAHVRRAATRSSDHPPRRALERSETGGEHSGFVEHLQRAVISGYVQLVPRAPVEGVTCVRPDLGRDAERSQKAERAASDRRIGDIEVHRDLAAALQVHAARRVEEPRELC